METAKSRKKCWIGVVVVTLSILYVIYQYFYYPLALEISWYDVIPEVCLVVISLSAIILLLRRPILSGCMSWLILGFSALLISALTDTLDEFLIQPTFITDIYEDLMQVIGYFMILIGLWQWSIVNKEMQDELNERVVTDFLTGALNRRGFVNKLEQEIQRSERYKTPLSLIWFDLDHFKQINDRYGHHHGDEVLRRTAQSVFGIVRKIDSFARMGGEEFCILMPETSLAGAIDAAEKLRLSLESCDCEAKYKVTASFGVDEFREGDSAESLMKRADDALYQAKAAGRNCVRALNKAED